MCRVDMTWRGGKHDEAILLSTNSITILGDGRIGQKRWLIMI